MLMLIVLLLNIPDESKHRCVTRSNANTDAKAAHDSEQQSRC